MVAIWKIGTPVQNLQVISSPAYVNRKGLLLTRKPSADQEDIESAGEGLEFDIGIQAANGEPIRFALRSKDSKVIRLLARSFLIQFNRRTRVVGYPLCCLLRRRILSLLLPMDSRRADSDLIVEGDSAGELKQSKHKTDANGHVQFTELPDVVGKEAGEIGGYHRDAGLLSHCPSSVGQGELPQALSFEAAPRFRSCAPDLFLQAILGDFPSSGREVAYPDITPVLG